MIKNVHHITKLEWFDPDIIKPSGNKQLLIHDRYMDSIYQGFYEDGTFYYYYRGYTVECHPMYWAIWPGR